MTAALVLIAVIPSWIAVITFGWWLCRKANDLEDLRAEHARTELEFFEEYRSQKLDEMNRMYDEALANWLEALEKREGL